jgi:hypothetical protein
MRVCDLVHVTGSLDEKLAVSLHSKLTQLFHVYARRTLGAADTESGPLAFLLAKIESSKSLGRLSLFPSHVLQGRPQSLPCPLAGQTYSFWSLHR